MREVIDGKVYINGIPEDEFNRRLSTPISVVSGVPQNTETVRCKYCGKEFTGSSIHLLKAGLTSHERNCPRNPINHTELDKSSDYVGQHEVGGISVMLNKKFFDFAYDSGVYYKKEYVLEVFPILYTFESYLLCRMILNKKYKVSTLVNLVKNVLRYCKEAEDMFNLAILRGLYYGVLDVEDNKIIRVVEDIPNIIYKPYKKCDLKYSKEYKSRKHNYSYVIFGKNLSEVDNIL